MLFPSYSIFIFLFGFYAVSSDENYFVYTYKDDPNSNEHCCLVRTTKYICKTIPLNNRLLQVTGHCQTLDGKKKTSTYLDQIIQRLNVLQTHLVGKQILIELEKPLNQQMLNNDLLCLSLTNNQINLDQCHLELINKSKDAADEGYRTELQLKQSVIVREGEGVSIIQSYTIDRTNTKANKKCWNWFRQQTKQFCQDHRKFPQKCIELNSQAEFCLEQLLTTDESSSIYESLPLTKGTKLFCQNSKKITKHLGSYVKSEVCLKIHDQLTIEHKFSDLVQLSKPDRNQEIFRFLAANDEMKKNFQKDCNDYETLEQIVLEPVTPETSNVEEDKTSSAEQTTKSEL